MIKLILIPLFAVFVFLPLTILGWIMVPLAAAFKAYKITELRPPGHPKQPDGHKYNFTWRIMFLWDNWEDGIANRNYKQFDSMFMQIVYWSCVRNPVNNLRIAPYLSCKINPDMIQYKGTFSETYIQRYKERSPHWFYCEHGLYSCIFWQFYLNGQLRRLWLGWKLLPQDKYGVKETDYRKPGAGVALQFKRIKT